MTEQSATTSPRHLSPFKINPQEKLKSTRVHHICLDLCFPANCFCCDGCCVWSPINPSLRDPLPVEARPHSKSLRAQLWLNTAFYGSIVILLVFNVLFLFFDARYLAREIHRTVVVISETLFGLVLITFLTTTYTDPGILRPSSEEVATQFEQKFKIVRWGQGLPQPPLRTQDILIGGRPFKLKYCYTCRFFLSPRANHCSQCNVCIDRMDHHCPWVGNCIGARNYRIFFLYLMMLALYGVYNGACVLAHLILLTRQYTFWTVIRRIAFGSFLEFLIIFGAVWQVLGLVGFHWFLVGSNVTTNEDMKNMFVSKQLHNNHEQGRYMENPFTLGSYGANVRQVLCGHRPPSQLINR